MEHEALLPYTQKLATGRCSEPDEPTPYPHSLLLKIEFNIFSLRTHSFPKFSVPIRFSD